MAYYEMYNESKQIRFVWTAYCLLLAAVKQVLLTYNKLCGKLQTNYLHSEGVASFCRRIAMEPKSSYTQLISEEAFAG